MLVEELLAELQFINDILVKRAENRKDFAEKVVEVITYGVSKVFSAGPLAHPLIAIGQIATDITGDVIQQILQHSKEKKLVRVGDIFYAEDNAKVEAIFRRLAKAVSLRY